MTTKVFLPSVIIFCSFIFARLLCRGARTKEEGQKKKKKKEKKRGKGSVNLLYSKAEESEGGKFTEGQMKLMVIYNNLKLTSHCH